MTEILQGIVASIFFSILLAFIEIASDSKTYNIRSYFTLLLIFYILIMCIGNILTTLIASNILEKYFTTGEGNVKGSFTLIGPKWIWYAVIGVFGFEVIIQKINITIFDKGVLSINDWISKARNSAVAATLQKAVEMDSFTKQQMADKIFEKFNNSNNLNKIHTYATNHFGPEKYQKLLDGISVVNGTKKISEELYLAYILANEFPTIAKSILKNKSSSNID